MAQKNVQARVAIVLVLLVPVLLLAYFYNFTKPVFANVPFAFTVKGTDTLYHELPVFELVTLEGDTIRRNDLIGKVLVIDFFSVNDDDGSLPYPLATVLHGNIKRIYNNVNWDKEPELLLLSVNTGDTLPEIRRYKANMDRQYVNDNPILSNRWKIAYGNAEDIYRMAQGAFRLEDFVGKKPGDEAFTAKSVALIDKEGRVRKYYVATDLQSERKIFEDYIALLRLEYGDETKVMRDR